MNITLNIASVIESAQTRVDSAVDEGEIDDTTDARLDLFAKSIIRQCAVVVADAHERLQPAGGDEHTSRAYAEALAVDLLARLEAASGFDLPPAPGWFDGQVALMMSRDGGEAMDDVWESTHRLWVDRFAERLAELDPPMTGEDAFKIGAAVASDASALEDEPGSAAERWVRDHPHRYVQ